MSDEPCVGRRALSGVCGAADVWIVVRDPHRRIFAGERFVDHVQFHVEEEELVLWAFPLDRRFLGLHRYRRAERPDQSVGRGVEQRLPDTGRDVCGQQDEAPDAQGDPPSLLEVREDLLKAHVRRHDHRSRAHGLVPIDRIGRVLIELSSENEGSRCRRSSLDRRRVLGAN